MPENLIEQIQAIENEADSILRAAQEDAAAADRDADGRIRRLEEQLAAKYEEESKAIAASVDAARQAEQDKLRKAFDAAIKDVRGIRLEQHAKLVDMIVQRICNAEK